MAEAVRDACRNKTNPKTLTYWPHVVGWSHDPNSHWRVIRADPGEGGTGDGDDGVNEMFVWIVRQPGQLRTLSCGVLC